MEEREGPEDAIFEGPAFFELELLCQGKFLDLLSRGARSLSDDLDIWIC